MTTEPRSDDAVEGEEREADSVEEPSTDPPPAEGAAVELESDGEADPAEGAPSIYDSVARLDADDHLLSRRTQSASASVTHQQRATSDVRSWISLGLALPLYGGAVGCAHLLPGDVSRLLLERGWIPHVIMMLTCWCLAILVVKTVGLKVQRRAFAVGLLPEGAARISTENVAEVIAHIESVRRHDVGLRTSRSFLVERILRILDHFAARGDAAETATVNTADADADAAAVASSFSLVKVLVWAIPILGFIGTVVGIGVAVGGFSQSLEGAEQLDSIKSSLGEVTSGLAVAFDTTLVALVASIFVMLPTSWVQKAEEQLMSDVDDYCVIHVLRRLSDAHERVDEAARAHEEGVTAAELRQLILDTVAKPLAEMLSANAALMTRLTDDHVALRGVHSGLSEQLSAFADASQQLGPQVGRAVEQLERTTALAERTTDAMGRSSEQLCRELGASRQLMQLLAAGMGHPMGSGGPAVKKKNGANGNGALSLEG